MIILLNVLFGESQKKEKTKRKKNEIPKTYETFSTLGPENEICSVLQNHNWFALNYPQTYVEVIPYAQP